MRRLLRLRRGVQAAAGENLSSAEIAGNVGATLERRFSDCDVASDAPTSNFGFDSFVIQFVIQFTF